MEKVKQFRAYSQVPKPGGWRGQDFQFGDPRKKFVSHSRNDLAASVHNLSLAMERGEQDCVLTSQVGLIVRRLAGVLEDHQNSEDVSRAIDQFGQQILAAARGLQ